MTVATCAGGAIKYVLFTFNLLCGVSGQAIRPEDFIVESNSMDRQRKFHITWPRSKLGFMTSKSGGIYTMIVIRTAIKVDDKKSGLNFW